jgi:MFS family permease
MLADHATRLPHADIVFYGNKLFQGKIIKIVVGSTSLYVTLQYTLLNSSVALVGYYLAALCIDKPWMGRRRLQNLGFFMTFLLFLMCAIFYGWLTTPAGANTFLALYLLSTFFGQFGPNSTTWLLPSEVFPTDIRTLSHGFSAASGKVGALIATLLFTYGDNGAAMGAQSIFYVCAACGAIGLVITVVFVPEVTSMDLHAMDERWALILQHRVSDYHGAAINPKYLSWFERVNGHSCMCKICIGGPAPASGDTLKAEPAFAPGATLKAEPALASGDTLNTSQQQQNQLTRV